MKTIPLFSIILLLGIGELKSQDSLVIQRPAFDSIQTLFQQLNQYQQIVIKTDLDSLIANKKEPKEQPAILIVRGDTMPTLEFEVQLGARGVYRRLRCEIPPVRINFSKKALDSFGLYPVYDKLKLVADCKQETTDTTTVLKEFWTYKLFNQVTDKSFRVHPLALTYIHEQDSTRIVESHAFIIENTNELAHRLGGYVYKGFGKQPKDLELSSYQNVLLFNYMIGNTDWIIKSQKNIKLIQHPSITQKILIPYDFDFTAIVHPSYWRIVRVDGMQPDTDNRVAMGHYLHWDPFKNTIEKFKNLRKTGFTCFMDCVLLPKRDKKNMKNYLASFNPIINNKRRVKEAFGGKKYPN